MSQLKEKALNWLENIDDDQDLAKDIRVVISVGTNPLLNPHHYTFLGSYDDGQFEKIYWACIGVRAVKLKVWYVRYPDRYRIDENGEKYDGECSWYQEGYYWIMVDEFVEFKSREGPWTREEFKEIVGSLDDRSEILEMLELLDEDDEIEIGPYFVVIVVVIALVIIVFFKRGKKRKRAR